ncbi:hypothetical protein Tco_1043585 [Tanacetum coccineum]|uniref:Uncharacterized protein n=1 Tax=Tanacetum coccineum TaxID=301880 RepID=A0ABQ5GNM8_9ASTR
MPELLSDRLKTILPNIIEESIQQALPKFDQRIQETLRSTMPDLLNKPLNKELNALNTLESQRFETLQEQLLKIYYYGGKLDKGELHMQELIRLMKDMVSLLDATNVFEKVKAEGEKVSLAEDIELELAEKAKAKVVKEAKVAEETMEIPQGEPQQITTTSTEEAMAKVQGEQPRVQELSKPKEAPQSLNNLP